MTDPEIRNCVLITVDSLRADAIGFTERGESVTPNIDRLAREGATFTQAITGGSWTQAAFPAIFTSTYGGHYGGCLERLSLQRPSPMETLRATGFATAGFTTNPHLSARTGYDRGFETFLEFDPDEEDPRLRNLRGGQALLRRPLFHRLSSLMGRKMAPARPYCTAREITDEIVQWLDGASEPFFVWAHFMDAHWPYNGGGDLSSPEGIAAAWKGLSKFHAWAQDPDPPRSEIEHLLRQYLNGLAAVDREIGRMMELIKTSGHANRTAVCIASDHGEEFWDHGRWGHWEDNLFDEIIKVPLIFAVPGQIPGVTVDRQVTTLDLMPTILELCGCPDVPGMGGKSLCAAWSDPDRADCFTEEAICEMPRESWRRIAVRTERFKFIWDSRHPETGELYDLGTDPEERRDVRVDFPEEARRLQQRVNDHLREASESNSASECAAADEQVNRRLRALGYL
jgi:arylsulfatase A-like enzyme